MTTATDLTFEQFIDRHRAVVGAITETDIPDDVTRQEFVDHLEAAVNLLATSLTWNSEQAAVEMAALYASDALTATPTERAVLLRKADEQLAGLDETDFLY